jgi:hypothetical protein
VSIYYFCSFTSNEIVSAVVEHYVITKRWKARTLHIFGFLTLQLALNCLYYLAMRLVMIGPGKDV